MGNRSYPRITMKSLVVILGICIAGAFLLMTIDKETPEFIKAIAYAICGALCARLSGI